MKNCLSINPEVSKMRVKALWYNSEKTQALYTLLINIGVKIDAFCMEEVKFDTFFGKKALSVFELIEEQEYALILPAELYDTVLGKYEAYGLERDRVYACVDAKKEIIYV